MTKDLCLGTLKSANAEIKCYRSQIMIIILSEVLCSSLGYSKNKCIPNGTLLQKQTPNINLFVTIFRLGQNANYV